MRDSSGPSGGAVPAGHDYGEALGHFRGGRHQRAIEICETRLAAEPGDFDAWCLMASVAIESGDHARALGAAARAAGLRPSDAAAHNNLGNALLMNSRHEEAVASYAQAIALDPGSPDALYNLGNALFDMNRFDGAIDSYLKAIERKPDFWRAHNNCGLACWKLGQHAAALAHFDEVNAIAPADPDSHVYRGHTLHEMRRFDEAVASFDAALTFQPAHAEALNARGSALAAAGRWQTALDSYDRAIAAAANFPEAFLNRGNVLAELGRVSEALQSYDRALALSADFAEAHYKRADALRNAGRYEEAVTGYDRAFALKPGLPFLRGTRIHARMNLCDWRDFDENLAGLSAAIWRGEAACPPFALAALNGSAALQLRAAEVFVAVEHPPNELLAPLRGRKGQRIRIGYFSADFRKHPVAYLTAGLFEAHDRAKFEVTAVSMGPDTRDEMRQRIEQGCDRFLDLTHESDVMIARRARELELDIAIDLGGFTNLARPGIFAARAAPVQMSYVGFLGTMAAPYMDYLVADPVLVPEISRRYFTESLVYLPWYQANDPLRRIADTVHRRRDWGLPTTGFVFCCFNSPYKITPATFVGWMRILNSVPLSVLWLYVENSRVRDQLRARARAEGIEPGRLVFAGALPMEEYLARYRCADLFLDTSPYNAGATASDALWAGLPVLTCPGQGFASRMAASLLTAADLPELIAGSPDEYEQSAIRLATGPALLGELTARLRGAGRGSRLFDLRAFVAHWESACQSVHERRCEGLPPADIHCG